MHLKDLRYHHGWMDLKYVNIFELYNNVQKETPQNTTVKKKKKNAFTIKISMNYFCHDNKQFQNGLFSHCISQCMGGGEKI